MPIWDKYQIDLQSLDSWPGRMSRLPPGVSPLYMHPCDIERLVTEKTIYQVLEPDRYPWARESFFKKKRQGAMRGRLLIAYSVDSRNRIVRGWYLTEFDQSPCSAYEDQKNCPIEAAWLATIEPGKPSEPAWLYLRPDA